MLFHFVEFTIANDCEIEWIRGGNGCYKTCTFMRLPFRWQIKYQTKRTLVMMRTLLLAFHIASTQVCQVYSYIYANKHTKHREMRTLIHRTRTHTCCWRTNWWRKNVCCVLVVLLCPPPNGMSMIHSYSHRFDYDALWIPIKIESPSIDSSVFDIKCNKPNAAATQSNIRVYSLRESYSFATACYIFVGLVVVWQIM